MARGIELATAYISIVGETKSLDDDIKKAFRGGDRHASAAGTRMGRKMSSSMGTELSRGGAQAGSQLSKSLQSSVRGERIGTAIGKVIGKSIGAAIKIGIAGAAAGAAAAVGGLTYALTKGFDRLKSIDQAKFKLEALGKSASEIESIVKTVTDVVTGTPFSLDAAFAQATQAVGANVKDLKGFMTAMADAAGFAGTDIERMGLVFNQVLAKGKADGQDLMQLMEAGLPIQPWLDSVGAMEDGLVTVDELVAAIQKNAGGMAQKLGESLQGAIDNAQTAAGRFGAALITAMTGGDPRQLTAGINGIKGALDNLTGWVETHVPEIVRAVRSIGSAFLDVASGAMKLYSGLLRGQAGLKRLESYLHWGDTRKEMRETADEMDRLADGVDREVKKNEERKRSWEEQQNQAANAAQAVEDLGEAVKKAQVDTKDGVILKAPTPADLDSISSAKYLVEQIPGTTDVRVIPRTAEASEELEAWRDKESEKPAEIPADADTKPAEKRTGEWREDEQGRTVWIPADADMTPAQTRIDDWKALILGKPLQIPVTVIGSGPTGNPILDAIPPVGGSGGGPGFTIGGAPGLPRSGGGSSMPGIYGLPASTNSGGYGGGGAQFPDWVNQVAEEFGIKPSTYPGHQSDNRNEPGYAPNPQGLNRGIDWTGPPENLQRFADYLKTVPGMEQVIWQNPSTGATVEVAGGRPQPGYFSGDLPGHQDHVHTRQSTPIPLPPRVGRSLGRAQGGDVRGPGGPKSDQIPAWLSNGEHVLTAKDVAAMGGQAGVYAFRDALHRAGGGKVFKSGAVIWPPMPPGPKDKNRPGGIPDLGKGKNPGPHLPDWGPGTEFGPPAGDWWFKPVNPDDILFPEWLGPGYPWKHPKDKNKITPFAEGGAVEGPKIPGHGLKWDPEKGWVEDGTPGIPIGQPHEGTGKPPGPKPEDLLSGPVAPGRTEGYIPAAAGNTGKTGGGVAGSFINLGSEAIQGVIQMAADLGKMAASAAASAGSFGAGAAAGPAAGAGIQMGADAAKRGVQYGAEMLNIGVGALTEQLFPFGAPRWLSDVDATGFMPQLSINPALTTTGEEAIQAIAEQNSVDPMTATHGEGEGQPPGPQQPQVPALGEPPGMDFLSKAIQPTEPPAPPPAPPLVNVENISTQDPNAVGQSIAKAQRLEMLRFAGRP